MSGSCDVSLVESGWLADLQERLKQLTWAASATPTNAARQEAVIIERLLAENDQLRAEVAKLQVELKEQRQARGNRQ